MTPDDIARGIWASSTLSQDQKTLIQPVLMKGAALREEVESLRLRRVEAQRRYLEKGAEIAALLGSERVGQIGRAP